MTTLFSNGYAIFIGVGADLPVTTRDAQALHDLFIHPDRAAYSPDRVKLLIEKDATKDSILKTLDTFAVRLSKDPNATMIVYFSGHGGYFSQAAEATEYFLLPNDYDASRREDTTISGDLFTEKIEALKAKRLVVLLDCCHAGGIYGAKGIEETFEKAPLPPTLLRVLETGSGQGIIASSLDGQKSYYDSSHSIFTSCLLDALSGNGARKNDGFARFLDVILYLFDEVPKRALLYGPQQPFINKIQGVSENFPLCFVDGGSKAIPFQEERLASRSSLSPGRRQRWEEEKSRLLEERSKHTEKLRRLRNAWAIETSEAHRYQLEQQILVPESRLAELDRRLDELEELLAPPGVKDKDFLPVTDDQKSPLEGIKNPPPPNLPRLTSPDQTNQQNTSSVADRLILQKILSRCNPTIFENVIFRLNPEPGILIPENNSQGKRAIDLLKWAENDGPGLEALKEAYLIESGKKKTQTMA